MNELTIQREITPANTTIDPTIWGMVESILMTSYTSSIERQRKAKQVLYALENGFPISLALTGGMYQPSGKNDRVEIEGKPLRDRIANDPNFDIKIIETNTQICHLALYRRASDSWAWELDEPDKKLGDWIFRGETTFTMEDADNYMVNEGGKWVPLSSRQTYKNTPQRMLMNRCTTKLVTLFGAGLFGSPIYIHGELTDDIDDHVIIEGETVTTINDLITEYGHAAVLNAMQSAGDEIAEIEMYLMENHDVKTM